MPASTAQPAIEVPIDALPPVDEHSIEIGAGIERTWEALVATLPSLFDTGRTRRGAALLGCEYREGEGEPSVIGSTLPGFVVARSVRPSTLALEGQHRYSRYALVFRIDELGQGRSRLRAETRAEFPGATGRIYRTLLMGSRGHVRSVRRILETVRKRAGGAPAAIDRAQIEAWVTRYVELWRTPGTDRLEELFAEDASYSTAPYEKSHVGIEAIAEMWEAERRGPDEVFEITSEVIAVERDTGIVRVEVRYGEPLNQDYRDLWIIRLDREGRCIHFEEWPFWPPGSGGIVSAGPAAD